MKTYCLLSLLLSFLLLCGCASQVVTEGTQLPVYQENQPAKFIQIEVEVRVSSSSGYSRVIKSCSKWEYVGLITKGNVYKPIGHIFTIEGYHVHEAYLVVNDKRLIGFYLPVENAFSGVKKEILLQYKVIDDQRI
jgi:hypothetical protein